MIAVYYLALVVALLLCVSAGLMLVVHLLEVGDLRREQQERRIDAWLREDAEVVRHEEGPHC